MSAVQHLEGRLTEIIRCLDLGSVLPGDVRICFVVSGPGGGTWTLESGADEPVRRGEHGPLDCRLACTDADLLALVEGRMSPRRGFLDGLLSVEGDVGLILRLQRALTRLDDQTNVRDST